MSCLSTDSRSPAAMVGGAKVGSRKENPKDVKANTTVQDTSKPFIYGSHLQLATSIRSLSNNTFDIT